MSYQQGELGMWITNLPQKIYTNNQQLKEREANFKITYEQSIKVLSTSDSYQLLLSKSVQNSV